jgi:hypothetical protein
MRRRPLRRKRRRRRRRWHSFPGRGRLQASDYSPAARCAELSPAQLHLPEWKGIRNKEEEEEEWSSSCMAAPFRRKREGCEAAGELGRGGGGGSTEVEEVVEAG